MRVWSYIKTNNLQVTFSLLFFIIKSILWTLFVLKLLVISEWYEKQLMQINIDRLRVCLD
jgi:hypothetical protein